jgi:hypothetical protein
MVKQLRTLLVTSMFMLSLTPMAYEAVADAQIPGTGPGASTERAGSMPAGQMRQEEYVGFGVVKGVDARNNTLTIETRTSPTATSGRDMTFALGEGALKGQNLSELKPGQYVQFTRTVKGTKVGPSHPATPGQDIKQPLEEKGEGTKVGPSHAATPEREVKQPLQPSEPSSTSPPGQVTAPAVAAEGETITSLEVLPESAWKTKFSSQSQSSR